ncbi:MAG: hypothetical protein FJW31_01405 [Acidobacteria bacterium]|nr:hypothetical protein [Acidobacteriota bacterium]
MRLLGLLLIPCAVFAQTSDIAIYNGASYTLRFPLAPGSFAKVSGAFAGVTSATATSLPLPKELGGVQVLVNNVAAPLYAVRADEITFQVPRGINPGRVPFRVNRGGGAVASGNVDILASAPGIFYDLADRNAQGGILNQAGAYAVQAAPAVRGQIAQIFGTGEGPLSLAVEDGAVPSALAASRNETKCFVSVEEAPVQFSGASPQFPGVWQVNITVPNRPHVRGRVPLFCTVNGISTNVVTFWVAE